MSKQKIIARHKARECALQAIYQWQFSQASAAEIEIQFHEDKNLDQIDLEYFKDLLYQIPKNIIEIDDHIEKVLDRPFYELNPVELAVLRIAVYELLYRNDVPYKVIINEALKVTKTFGAVEGFKYVNGVLDPLAKKLRSLEISLQQTNKADNTAKNSTVVTAAATKENTDDS